MPLPFTSSIAFDREEMLAWISRQAAFGARRAGSAAGLANERFLLEELGALGLENIRAEPIPVRVWEPKNVAFEVESGAGRQPLAVFPLPYCAFTPADGVRAPLVFADQSALRPRADWKGKIVVAEIKFPTLRAAQLLRLAFGHFDPKNSLAGVTHPATWIRLGFHLYRLAARSGAAGFVGILADQPGGTCRMYAPYGFRERDILDKPVPGVWVGRDAGAELRAAALAGASAHLTLTGSHQEGVTHNVVGEIPGRDTTSDEVVVLSCHHDSPFTSPVEDASGVAVVLALAKHFSATRDLKRRVVVLFSAGHFYGSIGTRTFIAQHADLVRRRAALEVSIEHIALEAAEGPGGALVSTGRAEPAAAFVSFNSALIRHVLAAVAAHGVDRVLALPAAGPLGNYPPTDGGDWFEAGVPVVNFIANPVYLLTDDDAPQWVDVERLPRVAAAFAALFRMTDAMTRGELVCEDRLGSKWFNRALGFWTRARSTFFGFKPLH